VLGLPVLSKHESSSLGLNDADLHCPERGCQRWEFEFPFPVSLISTFLVPPPTGNQTLTPHPMLVFHTFGVLGLAFRFERHLNI